MLIVHALKEHTLLEGVHRNINILVPYRIEVVIDNLRPRLGSILDQHTNIRIALPAKRTLDIFDIHSFLDMHANDTNRRLILRRAIERASHIKRLPLGRHTNTARLTPREGPPVAHALPGVRLLRLEQVVQADGHVPDDRVLAEVAVVDDFDGNRARVPVRAEELLCRLPDGRERVLDERRGVDPFVRANVDFAVWVEVLGEWAESGPSGVEFLRLVDDEADDADGCFWQGLEDPFDHMRFENRIECAVNVLACTSQYC
jgi:hypothetical protein